jgi:hypothetical protein
LLVDADKLKEFVGFATSIRIAELHVVAELAAVIEHFLELLEKCRDVVVDENVAGFFERREMTAELAIDESGDGLLKVRIANNLAELTGSENAFVAEHVHLSEVRLDVHHCVVEFDLPVLAQVKSLARLQWAQMRGAFLEEDVDLLDELQASFLVGTVIAPLGEQFFQLFDLLVVFAKFDHVLHHGLAFLADPATADTFLFANGGVSGSGGLWDAIGFQKLTAMAFRDLADSKLGETDENKHGQRRFPHD